MGKNRKAHRKKVRARNAQKKSQQNKVLNHIKDLGLTPMEALKKIQDGTLKPSDEVVFGPKATLLESPQYSMSLPQSDRVATAEGLLDTRTGLVTPFSQLGTDSDLPQGTQQ